jgi:molybdate transport system permease protein
MIALLATAEPLDPGALEAVWLSLRVALGCVLAIAAPGVAVGWLLARKQFPLKALLDGLIHMPLVLPPVVTGYVLLSVLGRRGPGGAWLERLAGTQLAFTTAGAVLASAIMAFPLMVRSVRLAIELVDPGLEQASLTLGVGPVRTFFRVTLPLAAPGVLAGLVLAFARSLGEFGATITFAGNIAGRTRTIPLAIFSRLQVPGSERQVLYLATISVTLSLAALVGSELLARRMRRQMEPGS